MEGTQMLTCCLRVQFGYWVFAKGGPLDIGEMCTRPGQPVLPDEADWVTARQFAACLGNAMSCNVLVYLLPEVLGASGLVSRRRAQELRQKAASLFPGNV